jgi:hypothetical protein
MSQSFEKKVGSRLQHYEPSPPAHLKSKVFEAVNPGRGLNGWQVTGMILFVFSFFFWLQEAMPGKQLVEQKSERIEVKETVQDLETTEPALPVNEEGLPSVVKSQSVKERINNISKPSASQTRSVSVRNETSNEKAITQSSGGSVTEVTERDELLTWQVDRRTTKLDYSFGGDIGWIPDRSESTHFEKEIVPIKRSFPFYMETGLFFLYQQAIPNMKDELVITDFEGAAGLSPSRLGANFEAGIHFSPVRKLRIHLGAKVNTYQQSYRFGIRSFVSDSVQVTQTSDEIVFNPVYDHEKITMDHRLYATGAKASFNWRIFPSYTNELVTSAEYLSILNRIHKFEFDGASYQVGYSDQWLFSVGMRKILMENKKGMLQVHPSIRYSLRRVAPSQREVLSMKPYSVGVSFSYIFGNFKGKTKNY